MKKSNELRQSLGLKQHEMAMLLGINRAQWSMSESGKRHLPTEALQKLAELLQQIETAKAINKTPSSRESSELESHLKKLLKENEYQRELTKRKLDALILKQTASTGLTSLAEILKTNPQIGKSANASAQSLIRKAEKAPTSNYDLALFDLRFRLDLLEHEKDYLESELRNLLPRRKIVE